MHARSEEEEVVEVVEEVLEEEVEEKAQGQAVEIVESGSVNQKKPY